MVFEDKGAPLESLIGSLDVDKPTNDLDNLIGSEKRGLITQMSEMSSNKKPYSSGKASERLLIACKRPSIFTYC